MKLAEHILLSADYEGADQKADIQAVRELGLENLEGTTEQLNQILMLIATASAGINLMAMAVALQKSLGLDTIAKEVENDLTEEELDEGGEKHYDA